MYVHRKVVSLVMMFCCGVWSCRATVVDKPTPVHGYINQQSKMHAAAVVN